MVFVWDVLPFSSWLNMISFVGSLIIKKSFLGTDCAVCWLESNGTLALVMPMICYQQKKKKRVKKSRIK